ncbi:hypothetical protein [Pengzhenrongella sp.]|uniref:hypothetical protein n=1 Tax=Pengzhenrongella sp. TaxID=2888820 RepID=UPI002F931E4C
MTAPAPARLDVQERPDVFSAGVAAAELGHRVEVSGMRTPTTSTFVNPNGTQVLESSNFSRNIPDAKGALAPVDTSVAKASDGSWGVGLHALRPRFTSSATSSSLAVATASGDVKFGLASPSTTSVATKDGTAGLDYPKVLPGVDLDYQVLPDAVKETLVLASASAGSGLSSFLCKWRSLV